MMSNPNCVADVPEVNKLNRKIESSLRILSWYNDRFNPYHVAFSGGRDSVVLAWLCKVAKVNYKLFFYDNVLIPKIDRDFIKKEYPNCIILKAKQNLSELCAIKKALPTRLSRFCCEYWKECYGAGSVVLTGLRLDESYSRSFRHSFEFGRNSRFKFYKSIINPLAFFSNSDILKIILDNHLILSDSYNFRSRNGCVGCPMNVNRHKELFQIFPSYKIIWQKAAEKVVWANKNFRFKSGSDLFEWWLSDLSIIDYFELKKQNKLIFEF